MSLPRMTFTAWLWLLAALVLVQPLSAQDAPADDPAEPAAEQPAQPETDAPPAEEAPAETPAVDDAPAVEEEPAADQPPADADKPAEDQPAEEPAPPTDAPAADAPADEPAADAPPAAGEAAQAFAAKLDTWKALLKDMRTLQEEYRVAEEAELLGMREQWAQLVERGQQMLPELRDLALAAFRESPGTDRQLSRFLVKMANDALAADRYETAHELATTLLEGNVDDKSLFQVKGAAAFVLNQYDEAGEYLTQAQQAGVLTQEWQGYLSEIENYKKYWAEEQQKREAEAAADDLPRVELNTTEGRIVVELFENEAPQTVGNFVSLVESGFYDGTVFHRVIGNFMAQGGDPEGTGGGGPGYNIYDEVSGDDIRMHFRGVLSMAKRNPPNTGGSQFFLTFVPTPPLNKMHTVFGRVIEGMDVLAEIQRDPGAPGKEPTKIESAKVLRKRDHEYKPTKVE